MRRIAKKNFFPLTAVLRSETKPASWVQGPATSGQKGQKLLFRGLTVPDDEPQLKMRRFTDVAKIQAKTQKILDSIMHKCNLADKNGGGDKIDLWVLGILGGSPVRKRRKICLNQSLRYRPPAPQLTPMALRNEGLKDDSSSERGVGPGLFTSKATKPTHNQGKFKIVTFSQCQILLTRIT